MVLAATIVAVLLVAARIAVAQAYAQDQQLREISGAAGDQCEPFAEFERCEGSMAWFDQRYGCEGARERVVFERCTPQGWLRVVEVTKLPAVQAK